ncbi:MAG: UDP-N-acetylmuramate--L-alanine ligase [Micavibrio sp.]
MRIVPQSVGTLHFIGIGGIGMSGIAEVLHAHGYTVQGSDMAEGYNTERLKKQGMKIFTGHDARHIDGAVIVVISSAIKPDNPELVAARAAGLPIVRRAEMLAEIMRLKMAVAIGGTHGKTTTTSMVGAMLEEGGFDPTVINGGIVNKYGTNTRMGGGEWMVVEADESDGTFTRLPATVAVVTNIDPEHLDHYGDYAAVKKAFRQFVENIPFYGFAVLCLDHPAVQAMVSGLSDRIVITYGMNQQADVRADNIRSNGDGSVFDVHFSDDVDGKGALVLRDVFLPVLGQHNVQNCLAALAIGRRMGMAPQAMKDALAGFTGVKRRFTKTGEAGGITVIDDYGHHPVEIQAVLKAARQAVVGTGGRVHAVLQPHRYTRLASLFEDFCKAFNDADSVLIADIYAAGEAPIDGASKEAFVQGLRDHGHKDAEVLADPDALAALVAAAARPGDFIICLGAGDITKWAYALPAQLEAIFAAGQKQRA